MLRRMESLINQLKKDKEESSGQVKRLQQDMQAAVLKIKVRYLMAYVWFHATRMSKDTYNPILN